RRGGTMQQQVRPRNWLLVLVAIPPLLGGLLLAYFLWTSITGLGSRLAQVEVPGTASLRLDAAGTYTVFYEYQSTVGGHVYSTPRSWPGLQVTVASEQTGQAVPVRESAGTTRYTFSGRSGYAAVEFTADRPGAYRLDAHYPAGRE